MITHWMRSRWHIASHIALLALGVAGTTTVVAATQGDAGASSTGSIDISLTIKPVVQVTGLQDISLSTAQGVPTSGMSPLCVFSNAGNGFRISAKGSGPADTFTLASDESIVSYEVVLSDATGRMPLQPNVAANNTAATASCNTSQSQLVVHVSNTHANPGIYTGTLTLLVTPD